MSNIESSPTKIITIRLRVPALVVMAVILLGGLIWAFVLGIMVGRGQIDDQLAALMPPAQNAADTGNTTENPADELERLIKTEDLKYPESLRQNISPQAPDSASPVVTPPEYVQQSARQGAQAPDQSLTGQKFNYVYQVASYIREAQAKEMQTKLQAKGIAAQIETTIIQNSSRFRVLISFQGDENSVQSMQDMLKNDFKITSILPRGKTPLGG